MLASAAPISLRDYQAECLEAIWAGYRRGARRQLVCLPTGTGKTVIFAQFPRYFRMRNRMLVLAHREELLEQAKEKLQAAAPDLTVEIEQAARRASPEADVVVASVATLGRKGSKRLQALDPSQFHLIVVDEAHHAAAVSYRRILDHFGVFDDDTKKLLVGFSATPKRADGVGLDEVFQEIVFSRDLPTMIAQGYLSPVAAYRVETDVDLSRVKTRMGDFVTSQLSSAVNTRGRNDLVLDIYRQRLEGRKTVCFCVDVAHAEELAEVFVSAGIPAAAVSGRSAPDARRKALDDFNTGRLRVLTNCMVLTEGYDEPSIEGIILARPTKSPVLYTQMIGRGTRLFEGKREVVIIDIVDVTRDHSLMTLPSLFGLSDRFDLEGKTTTELDRIIRWVEEHRPWVRIDETRSVSELRHRCQRVDLMALRTPPKLRLCSDFAWIPLSKSSYGLPLGGGTTVTLSRTVLGKWESTLHTTTSSQEPLPIAGGVPFDLAVAITEVYIEEHHPEAMGLVLRSSKWRDEPPTDKQLHHLRKHKLELPDDLRRGDASRLIAMLAGR